MISARFSEENSLSIICHNPFSRIVMYSLALICLSHQICSTPEDEKALRSIIPPFTCLTVTFLHYHHHHHYHHVVPLARISLTFSRHFSLSFIASGLSSGLHPVSSHSCCICVLAGRPAFALPYVGVNWSKSLMSSSLLLQQCPACLVRLT